MTSPNPIRIRLRYADVDSFVERFAPNVTRGGVFLASRNIQPVGSVVPFEIQLAAGQVVLAGSGRVSWVKEYNPAEPNRAYGMGVQFIEISPATKSILARILRAKETGGPARRPTTGPFVPLDAAGSGPLRSGAHPAPGSGAVQNGVASRRSGPPIDTSVDLVAEYGLDDQAVRRLIEQTWMSGARSSDDLGDLLKPEPPETVTLAQALAELPRLLDPQHSRRRATGTLRVTAGTATTTSAHPAPAADGAAPREAEGGERAHSTDEHAAPRAADDETTDMTGDRDPAETMHAAAPAASVNGSNGRRRPR